MTKHITLSRLKIFNRLNHMWFTIYFGQIRLFLTTHYLLEMLFLLLCKNSHYQRNEEKVRGAVIS